MEQNDELRYWANCDTPCHEFRSSISQKYIYSITLSKLLNASKVKVIQVGLLLIVQ